MDINAKIKEVKERLTQLTKNFPYTEEQINIFTICYIAMASIDNDITDLLDEVFSRVYILFNNGNFDKLLTSLGYPLDCGGFHKVPDFDLESKDTYEFININISKCIIFSYPEMVLLFEYITHELKHSINSIVNGFMKGDKESFSFGGLAVEKFNGEFYLKEFAMLDEAFNSFITKIYLEQIANLKEMDIEDTGIRIILDSFNLDADYLYAYECTEIWESLFKDKDIFRLFYNATLYHDYQPLIKALEAIFTNIPEELTEENEFILTSLDDISNRYEERPINNISNYFERKSECYPKRKLKIKPYFDNI